MGESDILAFLEMPPARLSEILAGEDPPIAAVRAAAVRDFMEAYHLTDRKDAIHQFARLRRAQAELLGLEGEEGKRFMEGFPEVGEYSRGRRV